jgi:cob(I)alamin adenosyltransferase
VNKDDIRVEICGCLDELCSFLGLARSLVRNRRVKNILQDIQCDLFVIGAELGTETRSLHKLVRRIGPPDIQKIEENIRRMEPKAGISGRGFYLPGESVQGAAVDVARAIARRAERQVVTFSRRKNLKKTHIIIYLNRLSDLLFILSRSLEPAPRKLASR